jgi:protein arginine kinase activator
MTFCDACGEKEATVFVTRISNNHTEKRHLCAACAKHEAKNDGVMANLHFGKMSLEEIAQNIKDSLAKTPKEDDSETQPNNEKLPPLSTGFQVPELSTLAASMSNTQQSARETASSRCPKCGTTWDRLRQDGRAGCARCYEAFSTQLLQVMERVHSAAQHAGKTPRALDKRKRRLHYLRARRDHRLEMLQRRLQETIVEEKYEEAAQLRDKIRILTNTIVHDN